jgi:hypothetical protein
VQSISFCEARAGVADEDRHLAEVRADAAVSRTVAAEGDRRSVKVPAEGALTAERSDADTLLNRINELKELLAGVVRAQKT